MAMALRNRKSYRARPRIEMWPEMARRNKNDPAKTHAAACFNPNTRNSQMPAAHRGPTARERARSVDNRRLSEVPMITALKQYYETEWRSEEHTSELQSHV